MKRMPDNSKPVWTYTRSSYSFASSGSSHPITTFPIDSIIGINALSPASCLNSTSMTWLGGWNLDLSLSKMVVIFADEWEFSELRQDTGKIGTEPASCYTTGPHQAIVLLKQFTWNYASQDDYYWDILLIFKIEHLRGTIITRMDLSVTSLAVSLSLVNCYTKNHHKAFSMSLVHFGLPKM